MDHFDASRRFSTADCIVAATALFIICNGVSVCIGWWLRIPLMVQLSPDSPTHFNTALIFILLGVGELGLVLRRRGIVTAVAVVVTCVTSAELAEHAFNLNLGIDTLFAVPFIGHDVQYQGRMTISVVTISVGLIWIFASPLARPFMLDPLYGDIAHRLRGTQR